MHTPSSKPSLLSRWSTRAALGLVLVGPLGLKGHVAQVSVTQPNESGELDSVSPSTAEGIKLTLAEEIPVSQTQKPALVPLTPQQQLERIQREGECDELRASLPDDEPLPKDCEPREPAPSGASMPPELLPARTVVDTKEYKKQRPQPLPGQLPPETTPTPASDEPVAENKPSERGLKNRRIALGVLLAGGLAGGLIWRKRRPIRLAKAAGREASFQSTGLS